MDKYFVLNRVPVWFRSRWPLKRFYWQPEQMEENRRKAEELKKYLLWDDCDDQ